MMDITPLTNKINLILGGIVAFLSYILGEHWLLFVSYLLLNVCDYISRWIAARITGTENSKACFNGILKKFGCWLIIALGFGMSVIFIEIGSVLGMNLEVTAFLGWFVLATLIINEIRSILENFVEIYGDKIPNILVKGLEVANKAIDGKIMIGDEGIETILHKSEKRDPGQGKSHDGSGR